MELNWSTFLLEIINFLVLVWILKHFFYRPVQEAIERRRRTIEENVAKAEALRNEAIAMKEQYAGRLGDWEEEKRRGREKLHAEIKEERTRLLAGLESELDKEREKAKVLADRRLAELLRANEEKAIAHGSRFAAQLLGRFADAALEDRLLRLLLEDLAALPSRQQVELRELLPEGAPQLVKITSAFPLSREQQQGAQEALVRFLGRSTPYEFSVDVSLVAGITVNAGPLVLRANLRDELQFFRESAYAREESDD